MHNKSIYSLTFMHVCMYECIYCKQYLYFALLYCVFFTLFQKGFDRGVPQRAQCLSGINFQFSISVLPHLSVSILWTIKILYCQLITFAFYHLSWQICSVLIRLLRIFVHFFQFKCVYFIVWCAFFTPHLSLSVSINPKRAQFYSFLNFIYFKFSVCVRGNLIRSLLAILFAIHFLN